MPLTGKFQSMKERHSSSPQAVAERPGFSIAAVERDTGIHKDTLRVWERRYGFPTPSRDANDERVYAAEQVDKLRMLRRLLDGGHRPGKVVHLGSTDLYALLGDANGNGSGDSDSNVNGAGAHSSSDTVNLNAFFALVLAHDIAALRQSLQDAERQLGLARFVSEVVAPLNRRVGEAWISGDIEIFEEHLYTEAVQGTLRAAISHLTPLITHERLPTIVLTTVPGEPHGLGLLMAEALFTLAGCRCLPLGVQTPINDIARAARAQRADVVALSFTASLSANSVTSALRDLRTLLPPETLIWAGGGAPVLRKLPPELQLGVRVLTNFADLPEALRQWRELEHAERMSA